MLMYPSERKQQTRARVLAEAAKALRAHGPHRVGVAGVMRRAGLTHGGFYAHFRSKDALIAAAIATMFEAARDRWIAAITDRDPAAGLGAYVELYLSAAHRDAVATGCPLAALASELPRLSGASRAAFADGTRSLTAVIAAKLAALGQRDHEALASSVVAELVGALSLARAEPDRARSTAMLAASRHALRTRLGLGGRP